MAVEGDPPSGYGTNDGGVQQRRERIATAILESQATRREKELHSLRSELAAARRQKAQLQQLLEEDSESHPSNKQARADRATLVKVRKELPEFHSTHAITKRELERAKDINDQSIVEYLALTRSVADWKRSLRICRLPVRRKTKSSNV